LCSALGAMRSGKRYEKPAMVRHRIDDP